MSMVVVIAEKGGIFDSEGIYIQENIKWLKAIAKLGAYIVIDHAGGGSPRAAEALASHGISAYASYPCHLDPTHRVDPLSIGCPTVRGKVAWDIVGEELVLSAVYFKGETDEHPEAA